MADRPDTADPHPYPDTDADGDTGAGLDRGSTTVTPRWVPVVLVTIGIVVVALFVVLHLTGTLGEGVH